MRAVRSRPEAQAWTTPALQSAALHCCTLPRCSQSTKEGGVRDPRGGQNSGSCCSAELFYTTRFDASVVTHRGLIRCSSGESEGTGARGRAKAEAGKASGKQRETGTCTSPRLYSARNKTENRINKQTTEKDSVVCLFKTVCVCVLCLIPFLNGDPLSIATRLLWAGQPHTLIASSRVIPILINE
jgi:hypothetical protein